MKRVLFMIMIVALSFCITFDICKLDSKTFIYYENGYSGNQYTFLPNIDAYANQITGLKVFLKESNYSERILRFKVNIKCTNENGVVVLNKLVYLKGDKTNQNGYYADEWRCDRQDLDVLNANQFIRVESDVVGIAYNTTLNAILHCLKLPFKIVGTILGIFILGLLASGKGESVGTIVSDTGEKIGNLRFDSKRNIKDITWFK